MATLMHTPTVAELTEAQCRRVMARRAALPDAWPNREERAEQLVEIDGLLEEWNLLVLGR